MVPVRRNASSVKPAIERTPVAQATALCLDCAAFIEVVRNAPLVAIDLLVHNARGEVLLGLRENRPARNCWFVPGGRIRKDERLPAAFQRIAREELACEWDLSSARFAGVYEHLYPDNFAGAPGFGTHYIALGYRVRFDENGIPAAPLNQHRSYRWFARAALLAARNVHRYTKRYFEDGG